MSLKETKVKMIVATLGTVFNPNNIEYVTGAIHTPFYTAYISPVDSKRKSVKISFDQLPNMITEKEICGDIITILQNDYADKYNVTHRMGSLYVREL